METQARASPQEGTEAQGAGLGLGIENRDSSNSLEGQKPKVEEGLLETGQRLVGWILGMGQESER